MYYVYFIGIENYLEFYLKICLWVNFEVFVFWLYIREWVFIFL